MGEAIGLMPRLVAVLALIWTVAAAVIEVSTYLPSDPEWSLLPTAALFGSSFFVAAIGAFFFAPELMALRKWRAATPRWLKWLGVVWALYSLFWFLALLTLPGIPTHCGTPGFPTCGHDYVFNSHGALTVTDRAGFTAGVRVLVRVFASPTIALMSIILVAYRLRGASPSRAISIQAQR